MFFLIYSTVLASTRAGMHDVNLIYIYIGGNHDVNLIEWVILCQMKTRHYVAELLTCPPIICQVTYCLISYLKGSHGVEVGHKYKVPRLL